VVDLIQDFALYTNWKCVLSGRVAQCAQPFYRARKRARKRPVNEDQREPVIRNVWKRALSSESRIERDTCLSM